MRKSLLILLLLSATFTLSAQGYKGKRFAASYEVGPSFLGRFMIYDRIIVLRNSLEVNYAINKRLTLGLGVNYLRRNLPDSLPILSVASKGFGNTENIIVNGYLTEGRLSDITLSFRMKYFARKNGGFAPMGRYAGLSVDYGFQNTISEYTNHIGEIGYVYDNTKRTSLLLFTATFGRNIIFQEKFLLGYGMTLGYNLTREQQFRRYVARPFVNFGILF
jgi:hypothetical protein